jgi:aminoglycoside phosphotransferase (APT) family kinase protein
MIPAPPLPEDPALPGLAAIRACGLTPTLPGLRLEGGPVELTLRGYTPGSRATLEACSGQSRVAVKAYAEDPVAEVNLYEALAAAGLAGSSGARVPRLLAWDRDLRLLVMGWLEGPTARQLVEGGQGARAGDLGARWLRRAADLTVKLGRPFGAARMLHRARNWVTHLGTAHPMLGSTAARVVSKLATTQPRESAAHLVHGTFYARHVLDLGDGPGVIDWMRFGQGPLELDAAMFLATIFRLGLRDASLAREVALAQEAFLAGTANLLNEQALAWHRSAALLRLADIVAKPHRRQGNWLAEDQGLLAEAAT